MITTWNAPRLVRLSRAAGMLVSLAGGAVLLGWLLDVVPLKSLGASGSRMSPGSALGFVLAGTALWLAAANPPRPKRKEGPASLTGAQLVAMLVALLGLLRVGGHVWGGSLGLDLLWFNESPVAIAAGSAAQMSPGTALIFLLVGTALWLATVPPRFAGLFQVLTLSGLLLAWLGFSRHLYGGEPLLPLARMALPTASAFVLLAGGLLCSRTDTGLMALLTSDSAGGLIARRLLPAAMLVPVGFGWLRLQAQRAGWFGTEAGLSLFVVLNVAVFGGLVWASARQLHRTDAERRQAERAERQGQQLLEAIIDNSAAVVYVKDLQGRYLLVNRRYEEIFHLTRGTILGRTDHELFSKEAADAFRAIDRRVAADGIALTEEEVAPQHDGPHTYISVKCPLRDPDGKTYGVFGISTDITERKNAERIVRESEGRLRMLAESLPHLVWTCRPDGYCDYLSRQWIDYTGRPEAEQLGSGWAEHLHPADREHVQAAWTEATKRGDYFDVEFRIRRHDGVYRWFKTRAVPLRDATGQIVKWFGSNTDFEDYKQAEAKVQAQLARLDLLNRITRAIAERQDLQSIFQVVIRSVEESLPVDFCCVCRYDAADPVVTVTSVGVGSAPLAMELAMTEHARVDIDENGLSRCVRGRLVYEPDVSQVQFPFPQRLARGGLRALVAAPLLVESKVFGLLIAARRAPQSFSSGECEFLKQVTEHVALASHQAQLYGALQQAYDDLRQTQQAIMQQERLRALGQMASGIAHDINNAISPVSLYTETLLEREPNLSAKGREYLRVIQHSIEDVAQTVSRMREFYRQREPQLILAPVNLSRLAEQVADLTRARWSDMPQQRGVVVELRREFAADLPAVMAVESEIREALINLVFNAVDAMPEGGTLIMRTGLVGGGERPQVEVQVADTGVGMSEDTRRRCLEPFFTTKGERGTGLGLAMVYGTVQRHSAELDIDSTPGRGTVVSLRFAPPSADTAEPGSVLTDAKPAGRLRLLLVDDDPLLIKSLRDTLEGDGHEITWAMGGKEGIAAFGAAQHAGIPFAAVITDLGMPHVDGRQVASAVKAASPTTPVILLTGWGQRLIAEGDVPPHVDRVLNKPPKLRELRAALAAVTA